MKRRLRASGCGHLIALAIVIATVGTACTSGGGGAGDSGATAGQGGAAAPGANPASGGNGGKASPGAATNAVRLGLPADVGRVLKRAHSADRATYTATYRVTLPGGLKLKALATVRVAQRYPKFRYQSTQGKTRSLAVYDGSLLHTCEPVASGWRCAAIDIAGDPSLVSADYPGAVLQYIEGLTAQLSGGLGAKLTSRTVLGHKVDCAAYAPKMRNPPAATLYCVRSDGVLAYSRTSDGQVMELASFSASVSSGDLVVPR
jgi:hypothetical protein